LDLEEPKDWLDFLGDKGSSVEAVANSTETIRSEKLSGITASGLADPGRESALQTANSSAFGNLTMTVAPMTSDLKTKVWEEIAGRGVVEVGAEDDEAVDEVIIDPRFKELGEGMDMSDVALELAVNSSSANSSKLVETTVCARLRNPSNLRVFFLLLAIRTASLKRTRWLKGDDMPLMKTSKLPCRQNRRVCVTSSILATPSG
jgi:hypothetical protein